MTDHYHYPETLDPVQEKLDHQTKEQFEKNYAQTVRHVYELTYEQAQMFYQIGVGSGSGGNWVPAKAVFINGEVVLRIKFRNTTVLDVLPYTA